MTTPSQETLSGDAAYAQLLSLAAHEFRSPASVVGGYLHMLRNADPPLGDSQRKMVEEAEKACARMVALIAELSEIAKLDANTAAVADASFDLFPTLADVAAATHESQDCGVSLHVRSPAAGAPTKGDLARIRGAFAAFFRAVLREQPAACRVVVDCRVVDSGATASAIVAVAPENDLERAMAASHAPFNESRGGLGLALPIARRVIERHGGRVWSPSAAPESADSRGSAIIVSLPLRD